MNGQYVLKAVLKDKRKRQIIIVETGADEYGEEELKNTEIKTIVTKEQFESISYKVKE